MISIASPSHCRPVYLTGGFFLRIEASEFFSRGVDNAGQIFIQGRT